MCVFYVFMVMAGTEPAVSPMRGKSGARSDLEELTSSLRVALAGAWNLWPTQTEHHPLTDREDKNPNRGGSGGQAQARYRDINVYMAQAVRRMRDCAVGENNNGSVITSVSTFMNSEDLDGLDQVAHALAAASRSSTCPSHDHHHRTVDPIGLPSLDSKRKVSVWLSTALLPGAHDEYDDDVVKSVKADLLEFFGFLGLGAAATTSLPRPSPSAGSGHRRESSWEAASLAGCSYTVLSGGRSPSRSSSFLVLEAADALC